MVTEAVRKRISEASQQCEGLEEFFKSVSDGCVVWVSQQEKMWSPNGSSSLPQVLHFIPISEGGRTGSQTCLAF
jgi:hypothetical protein